MEAKIFALNFRFVDTKIHGSYDCICEILAMERVPPPTLSIGPLGINFHFSFVNWSRPSNAPPPINWPFWPIWGQILAAMDRGRGGGGILTCGQLAESKCYTEFCSIFWGGMMVLFFLCWFFLVEAMSIENLIMNLDLYKHSQATWSCDWPRN